MKFTKFIIHAGKIAVSVDMARVPPEIFTEDFTPEMLTPYEEPEVVEIDTESLDSEMLNRAVEILALLRDSDDGVTYPLPVSTLLTVGLGEDFPFTAETMERIAAFKREIKEQAAPEEAAALPDRREPLVPWWEEHARQSRSTQFYIAQADGVRGTRAVYYIVPGQDEERLRVYEAIAASFYRSRIEMGDGMTDAELRAHFEAVAEDIWRARPAVACCGLGGAVAPAWMPEGFAISAFIDCFAAAMLLHPHNTID